MQEHGTIEELCRTQLELVPPGTRQMNRIIKSRLVSLTQRASSMMLSSGINEVKTANMLQNITVSSVQGVADHVQFITTRAKMFSYLVQWGCIGIVGKQMRL